MNLDDIQLAIKRRRLVTLDEVSKAEKILKIQFPPGYADFVTTLGEGVLSNWGRIYPPWQVVNELETWRDTVAKTWFWDRGKRKLSLKESQKCFPLADTLNGDQVVIHPSKPEHFFVLPIEDDDIHTVKGDLFDLLDWLCTSGKLTKRLTSLRFKPASKSTRVEMAAKKKTPPNRKKTGAATELPARSPEDTLTAYWDAFTALAKEHEQWRKQKKEDKIRRGEPTHVWTEDEDAESNQFLERDRQLWEKFFTTAYEENVFPNEQYAQEWRDRVDRVEIKGSKAYVYTRRPDFPSGKMDPKRRKFRWVLQLVDGIWRIKSRQKEGMKVDTYRPTYVK